MQVSATRVDPECPLDPEVYPGSVQPPEHAKLPVETLIDGYTRQGAKPLRLEEKTGTLEPCISSEFQKGLLFAARS